MTKWIKIEDQEPENGQEVYYFFEFCGVHKGNYKRLYSNREVYESDEDYEQYKHCYHRCFYGKKGFLVEDVTHWMPYEEGSILPERPYLKNVTVNGELIEI